jgi:hypothetical protein
MEKLLLISFSLVVRYQPYQGQLYWDWASHCPDNPGKILQECGDNVPCLYDYTLLNAEVLGNEVKDTWNSFFHDRHEAIRTYNSCGPINIEYPVMKLEKGPTFSYFLFRNI